MPDKYKPILCLDFDGVIHSYTSGWKGADVITDDPVPGAIDALNDYSKHFRVAIYSSRSGQPGGIDAMQSWLVKHWVAEFTVSRVSAEKIVYRRFEWPLEKPPAMITLDDRAIQFTGVWPSINELKDFKPWNKK